MVPQDALRIVSRDMYTKVALPAWLISIAPTKHIADVKVAFEELEVSWPLIAPCRPTHNGYLQQYMHEMVNGRRNAEKKEERYDLFSSLLDASDTDSDGKMKLTDQELLGKRFALYTANHANVVQGTSLYFCSRVCSPLFYSLMLT